MLVVINDNEKSGVHAPRFYIKSTNDFFFYKAPSKYCKATAPLMAHVCRVFG